MKLCRFCGSAKLGIFCGTSKWRVQFCRDCTNAWTDPPPAAADQRYDSEDFHAQFRAATLNDLPNDWKRSAAMQVDLLRSFLSPGARIFEIGCGQGLLLQELAHRNFATEGMDPSASAVEAAHLKKLNVVQGYFPTLMPSGRYDAVIVSHVLEHVENPIEFVNAITRIIEPSGLIMLVQSNWTGWMPFLLRSKWYAWVPSQHFWHFSPRGLSKLLDRTGYETLRIQFSNLVHRVNPFSALAGIYPEYADQFHLVARHTNSRSVVVKDNAN